MIVGRQPQLSRGCQPAGAVSRRKFWRPLYHPLGASCPNAARKTPPDPAGFEPRDPAVSHSARCVGIGSVSSLIVLSAVFSLIPMQVSAPDGVPWAYARRALSGAALRRRRGRGVSQLRRTWPPADQLRSLWFQRVCPETINRSIAQASLTQLEKLRRTLPASSRAIPLCLALLVVRVSGLCTRREMFPLFFP